MCRALQRLALVSAFPMWNDEGIVSNATTESLDVSNCGLYFRLPKKIKERLVECALQSRASE